MAGTPNYQYAQGVADLQNRYAQDKATQEYGRFLGQQRFSRQKEDLSRGFLQQFPKFTAQYARRLGSNVRSGRLGADMATMTNDYGRQVGAVDEAQAGFQGDWNMKMTQASSNYQAALRHLHDQLQQGRAIQDPFQTYVNVWGQ
jgi:hypothetical protein